MTTASDDKLPINGARAVMSARVEPDGLDYFPTPPWATRALPEHILPHLGLGKRFHSVLEPAAGEGHMAEPLKEYADHVFAADLGHYGYCPGGIDFLDKTIAAPQVSWVIANPPTTRALVLKFALRALEIAPNVAIFARLQWLETAERYHKLFRPHPPTLIAVFSERVPLHRGRWVINGSTATSYCWLVWVKGMPPRPLFWIPPGCRKRLSKPDDPTRLPVFWEIKTEIGKTEPGKTKYRREYVRYHASRIPEFPGITAECE
jgi:hypothetical protein